MNYRLGWIVILGMSGALACGDSLHQILDDLDLPLDHLPEPPTNEPPWTDPPDPPDAPGASDAGADAVAPPGPDEPPVVLEPCDPGDPQAPPAVDAGPPPVEPPPVEPPPVEPPPDPQPVDAGTPAPEPVVDAGPPIEPPIEEPPPVKKPPVKKPPIEPPPPPVTSFEANVWPIFVSNCTPCHTTLRRGGHSVGSADLAVAFADATLLGSTLIERLDGGGMPLGCEGVPGDPGCISIEDLATVQAWIDDGLAP
jgi:hypothetical protein